MRTSSLRLLVASSRSRYRASSSNRMDLLRGEPITPSARRGRPRGSGARVRIVLGLAQAPAAPLQLVLRELVELRKGELQSRRELALGSQPGIELSPLDLADVRAVQARCPSEVGLGPATRLALEANHVPERALRVLGRHSWTIRAVHIESNLIRQVISPRIIMCCGSSPPPQHPGGPAGGRVRSIAASRVHHSPRNTVGGPVKPRRRGRRPLSNGGRRPIMPTLPTFAELHELHDLVQALHRVVRDLESDRTLRQLAQEDRERWDAVADALAATLEPGEPGTLVHVRDVLDAALEDP